MVTKMRKPKELNDKNEFYAVKQTGGIVYLKLDLSYIFEDKNLHIRDKLTYLFDQISKSLDIKVLAIINQNGTANLEKYMNMAGLMIAILSQKSKKNEVLVKLEHKLLIFNKIQTNIF